MLTGRLLAGTPTTERPLIAMSPASGSANPAIIRMIVVLPQPDGPRIEKKRPGGTANDTPATATVASKRLRTSVSSRSAVVIPRTGRRRRPPAAPATGGRG